MKNIFVYSDSFHTYEFVNVIDHLLNFRVNEINLLNENHDMREFKAKGNQIKMHDNIQQCIENSDVIILLNTPNLPTKVVAELKEIIKIKQKKLVDIDLNLSSSQMNTYRYNHNENIPVILNISIGNHSANFCLEIILNKILSSQCVDFWQEYNTETAAMLRQLNENSILNNALCTKKTAGRITIRTVHYSNFQEMVDASSEIQTLLPDYIILNTNYRLHEYDKIKDYIYYRYGIPLFIVKSNFAEVYRAERSMKCVYCVEKQEGIHYINDDELELKLKFDIFSHLSFPNEIYTLIK